MTGFGDKAFKWVITLKGGLQDGYVHAKLLQLFPILCNPTNHSLPGSSVHGDSPGKNTGMGYHDLQGIFPTQG